MGPFELLVNGVLTFKPTNMYVLKTQHHNKNRSGLLEGVCEGTYTLHFTIYEPIHHNICQCSCRVNRIINKYPPVNDHRAVISPHSSPAPRSISASHTHTHTSINLSSITLLCQSSNSVSQLGDKAWHYRADLSLLCLCEWSWSLWSCYRHANGSSN